MLVAITGASGFIGSVACAALKRRGHRVRALLRAASRRDHIDAVVDETVEGPQDDPVAMAALVEGVDAVIHASADWNALGAGPEASLESNLLGSLRLLERTRLAGVGQFIFVSSVAVHHETSDAWNGRLTETHPLWPGGIYGAYKAAVEAHLKAYHHAYGMNTSAWRPAAVYGIDPALPRSQWYDLIRSVRGGGRVDETRGGKITHVQDVADALALAVGDAETRGRLFNLVDCYLYRQQVAEMARDLSGSTSTIVDRRGPGPRNQFDCSAAIAFFDRHGNAVALRRGLDGVRDYVEQLLRAMPA